MTSAPSATAYEVLTADTTHPTADVINFAVSRLREMGEETMHTENYLLGDAA